jgi:hypothetical protein
MTYVLQRTLTKIDLLLKIYLSTTQGLKERVGRLENLARVTSAR